MVLEDATTPDSSFSVPAAAPTSDMDRYSGDQNPTILETRSPTRWPITRPNNLPPLYIDFSNLKMPWFPIFQSRTDEEARKSMGETLQRTSDDFYKNFGRPLEQTEADAAAFHLSKAMRISSFGPPLGGVVAFSLAAQRKAWDTFRFPGWTPSKERFNPDKFFMMKGPFARVAWHGLRFNAYLVLGVLAGELLMGSYAMTVANVGRLQDPRLRDVNETLKKRTEKLMREKNLPIEDRTAGRRGQETFEMARQRTRAQGAGARAVVDDDMSPTGGSFREDFGESATAGGDEGMLSDSQIQQLQQRERRGQEGENAVTMARSAETPSRPAPQASNTEPPASRPAANSWERLRQQAQTSQPPQQQQSARGMQPNNTDDDDAFGFSNGGRDSHLSTSRLGGSRSTPAGGQSKSDAQREFDAQLDREREGKGFEEKGSGGRW